MADRKKEYGDQIPAHDITPERGRRIHPALWNGCERRTERGVGHLLDLALLQSSRRANGAIITLILTGVGRICQGWGCHAAQRADRQWILPCDLRTTRWSPGAQRDAPSWGGMRTAPATAHPLFLPPG